MKLTQTSLIPQQVGKESEERGKVQAMMGQSKFTKQTIMGSTIPLARNASKKHIQRDFWVWGLGQGLLGTGTGNLMNVPKNTCK